jgi:hypothetical protein
MESVFVVVKIDDAMKQFADERVTVDVYPNSELASKWLMQLVNNHVLCNGFDATIKSRYNVDGEIELSAELVKGENQVSIYTKKKSVYNKV